MGKYFKVQIKRLAKLFPFILVVTVILFSGLTMVFSGIVKIFDESSDNKIFQIGIAGDTDNQYFKVGIVALETFDSSRFSIKIVEMEEKEAEKALGRGDISAYVVMPDGFVSAALRGDVMPIKYVTTSGAVGMTSIFKEEITLAIQQLFASSTKGVFGLENALDNNGYEYLSYNYINQLNVEYIDLIVDRSGTYTVKELGISAGTNIAEYLFCGITVLFLLLIGLPYATVFIKKDRSLSKVLASKSVSVFRQMICEYGAYFLSVALIAAIVLSALSIIMGTVNGGQYSEILNKQNIILLFLKILPVIALTSAFNVFIFEIANDIVSGVLLQFFATLSLCYITGCMYPIYAFPKIVQRISSFLPTGIARGYLIGCVTEETSVINLLGIVIYFILFFAVAAAVKQYKTVRKG